MILSTNRTSTGYSNQEDHGAKIQENLVVETKQTDGFKDTDQRGNSPSVNGGSVAETAVKRDHHNSADDEQKDAYANSYSSADGLEIGDKSGSEIDINSPKLEVDEDERSVDKYLDKARLQDSKNAAIKEAEISQQVGETINHLKVGDNEGLENKYENDVEHSETLKHSISNDKGLSLDGDAKRLNSPHYRCEEGEEEIISPKSEDLPRIRTTNCNDESEILTFNSQEVSSWKKSHICPAQYPEISPQMSPQNSMEKELSRRSSLANDSEEPVAINKQHLSTSRRMHPNHYRHMNFNKYSDSNQLASCRIPGQYASEEFRFRGEEERRGPMRMQTQHQPYHMASNDHRGPAKGEQDIGSSMRHMNAMPMDVIESARAPRSNFKSATYRAPNGKIIEVIDGRTYPLDAKFYHNQTDEGFVERSHNRYANDLPPTSQTISLNKKVGNDQEFYTRPYEVLVYDSPKANGAKMCKIQRTLPPSGASRAADIGGAIRLQRSRSLQSDDGAQNQGHKMRYPCYNFDEIPNQFQNLSNKHFNAMNFPQDRESHVKQRKFYRNGENVVHSDVQFPDGRIYKDYYDQCYNAPNGIPSRKIHYRELISVYSKASPEEVYGAQERITNLSANDNCYPKFHQTLHQAPAAHPSANFSSIGEIYRDCQRIADKEKNAAFSLSKTRHLPRGGRAMVDDNAGFESAALLRRAGSSVSSEGIVDAETAAPVVPSSMTLHQSSNNSGRVFPDEFNKGSIKSVEDGHSSKGKTFIPVIMNFCFHCRHTKIPVNRNNEISKNLRNQFEYLIRSQDIEMNSTDLEILKRIDFDDMIFLTPRICDGNSQISENSTYDSPKSPTLPKMEAKQFSNGEHEFNEK